MNKKILALLLAFAMMFSTITVAFADSTATIGADAEALKIMGVLQGDNSTGVTPEYLAKETTRMQAAIMYLRLKGLEDEAMAFTGTTNFADVNTMAWGEGKAIMAYLKANPQLGWVGADFGKFEPFTTITVNQYYKVMLEALGYKQTTAEVEGDFEWKDVMTFAASKGLVKLAGNTKFTNNDLAIATIEGLLTNMKDGGKTLVVSLVDSEMINKEAAIKAGLYAATTSAVVESVKAIGNTKVLVEFDSEVGKAFAENAANYKVVEKGTTTALEVKAAVLDGTDMVVLETAAQTAGKAYTMTVGEVSVNFAGISKDSSVPEIDDVTGTDTEKVVIDFTTTMDLATALDKANYAIAGVTVENAAWEDDSERDSVELTTKGLVTSKTYKVTVTNVKSVDGIVMRSDSMNFVSKADKKAPTLIDDDKTQTFVDTNTRIIVTFDDNNELTKESAENVDNYELKIGNTDSTLEILSAKLVEDDNDDMKRVELTTASQKNNQKYVLAVNGLVDTSVLGNKMAKEETVNLYGEDVDEDAPELVGMEYVSNTLVEVEFEDDSRLDTTSVLDINNYEFDNDVTVEAAKLKNDDDADNMKVILTVSKLGGDSRYELTVNNISDEYGNVMDQPEDDQETFKKEEVNRVAGVKKVSATSDSEIVIYFDYKTLDEASAEDVANYSIDGNIGTPTEAEYDEDSNTVTLTTKEMNSNTEYEVTVNGVKDIAGNTLVNVTADVVVASTENDIDAPEVQDVEAIYSNIIAVTFDEAMNVAAVPTITIDSEATGQGTLYGKYAVSSDEDDTVLEFTLYSDAAFTTPAGFSDDEDVVLEGVNATDLAGNKAEMDAEGIEFSSTDEAAEDIELDTWDQTDVYTFELQYSEKVALKADGKVHGGGYDFTIEVDEDDETIVTLTSDDELEVDDEIYLKLTDELVGFHGQTVLDSDEDESGDVLTYLEAELEDEDEPFIEKVEAVDSKTLDITFNENLGYKGEWKILFEDEDGEEDEYDISATNTTLDDNVVTLKLTGSKDIFESDKVYSLSVTRLPEDLAGNEMDAEKDDEVYDFIGTDVAEIGTYITGVKVVNGTTVTVYTNNNVDATGTKVLDGNDEEIAIKEITADDTDEFSVYNDVLEITIGEGDDAVTYNVPKAVLADGTTYTVKIGSLTYEFSGIVTDEIDIDKDEDAFNFDYDDIKAGDLVAVLQNGAVVGSTVVKADEETTISGISGEVNVVVMRGNVVLYFLQTDLADIQ